MLSDKRFLLTHLLNILAPEMKSLRRFMPVGLVMAAIFFFSHLPGEKIPDLGEMDLDKLLHALEYAILALSAIFAIIPYFQTQTRWKFVFCVVFFCLTHAIFDEFHQSLIPLRTASSFDVLADLVGALSATAAWFIYRRGKI